MYVQIYASTFLRQVVSASKQNNSDSKLLHFPEK